MKSSIDLLSKVNDKRRVAILGDILELGDYSIDIHKNIGKVLIEDKIDLVITIGEYSKNINEVINNYIENYHFDKEYESYDFLEKTLNEFDCVLIKGSHAINLKNIVEYLMKK